MVWWAGWVAQVTVVEEVVPLVYPSPSPMFVADKVPVPLHHNVFEVLSSLCNTSMPVSCLLYALA